MFAHIQDHVHFHWYHLVLWGLIAVIALGVYEYAKNRNS